MELQSKILPFKVHIFKVNSCYQKLIKCGSRAFSSAFFSFFGGGFDFLLAVMSDWWVQPLRCLPETLFSRHTSFIKKQLVGQSYLPTGRFEPRPLLLWSKSVNHCTNVPLVQSLINYQVSWCRKVIAKRETYSLFCNFICLKHKCMCVSSLKM